jgi:diguanylate cyclase (GGDEF)-like protein
LPRSHHLATAISIPGYAVFLLAAATIFLGARFLLTRKPVDAAFMWSLLAFCLSLRFVANIRISALYSVAAACILAASIVENSYLLAYQDELTGLPARRAFNDAMLRLHAPYSIAVVDIDHFKNFNDTYGHDIGDEVLRLVATTLARVTGGGQAFRYGGEEFTILFQGKTTDEVVEHLEKLRERIQMAEFRMRGGERRQVPRGPDRRNARTRSTKGHAIRQLAKEPAKAISVTVSMGVATGEEKSYPEGVIQAADKALYRAKANGRNQVETADRPRRVRAKAADIA